MTSAFFDKRSKFIHYHPKTLILNNLEYDHADIFPDLDAIKQQFHYQVRTVPGNGCIIRHSQDHNLADVIAMGCWTPVVTFSGPAGEWQASLLAADGSAFSVMHAGNKLGDVHWDLLGRHNVDNALAAIAAASHAGVPAAQAIESLAAFKNVKRRLEVKGKVNGIVVYDDFAHHPTAIETTLAGLRARINGNRLVAVIEFGSYTMRTGVHKDRIRDSLRDADMVVCKSTDTDWGLNEVLAGFEQPVAMYNDVDALVRGLVPQLAPNDHVVIMSNSGFGGIHNKLLQALKEVK